MKPRDGQDLNKGTRYGLIGGAVFGAVFGPFYALASWLVCSGTRDCPGHWAPYLAVVLIAFAVCVGLGAVLGTVILWFYRLTKV